MKKLVYIALASLLLLGGWNAGAQSGKGKSYALKQYVKLT